MDIDAILLVDFESRNDSTQCDLKKVGGRIYWEHPTTEVVCASFGVHGSDEIVEWAPTLHGSDFPGGMVSGKLGVGARIVAAHNAHGFDKWAWRRMGWPEPEQWVDTSLCARRRGMKGGLDAISKALGLPEKDAAGSRLVKSLSKPSRAKATLGQLPAIGPVLLRVMKYCSQDVRVMHALLPLIADFIDLEPELEAADLEINDLGVPFDRELAERLLEWDAVLAAEACGVDPVVMRPAHLVARLRELGVPVTKPDTAPMRRVIANLDKLLTSAPNKRNRLEPMRGHVGDIAEARKLAEDRLLVSGIAHAATFMRDMNTALYHAGSGTRVTDSTYDQIAPLVKHADPVVAGLAGARLAVASIARGKLTAGLARVSPDGWLRDNTRMFGAHTGRWAGQGMQLQNMTRPSGKPSKWKDRNNARVIEAIKTGRIKRVTQQMVDTLIRACFVAPDGHVFAVCDYSQVEARGLAWEAGDDAALRVFNTPGVDAYLTLAAKLYGQDYEELVQLKKRDDPETKIKRQMCKVAELGLGYQMGLDKFIATAEADGVVWEKVGLDPADVHEGWRELHAPIVQHWRDLNNAALEAVDGGVGQAGPVQFARVGEDLWMMLPSGRPIVYPRARTEPGQYGPSLVYLGERGWTHMYGGKLAENETQAICRELLAHALVNCRRVEMPVCLTVHDEVVAIVPAKLANEGLGVLTHCMLDIPEWAAGFPIAAEGYTCKRYAKH